MKCQIEINEAHNVLNDCYQKVLSDYSINYSEIIKENLIINNVKCSWDQLIDMVLSTLEDIPGNRYQNKIIDGILEIINFSAYIKK